MSREKWPLALTLLLTIILSGVVMVSQQPPASLEAQASREQLIYHGTITQTTEYLVGDFYGYTYRYVSGKFGWNDTTTSTVTTTLWLADPFGTRCCTETITSSLGISTTYTTWEAMMTGQYWADLQGTIENITGTITSSVDIILHGQ